MFCNSVVPSIKECDDKICSIRVDPDLGKPTTKIGSAESEPDDAIDEKKSFVKKFLISLHSLLNFFALQGTC